MQVGAQVTPPFEISGTGGNVLCKQFQVSSFQENLRFQRKSGRECALHLFGQDGQGRAQNFETFNP